MAQRLVQLTLLCLWLAACAVRPPEPGYTMRIPDDDPVLRSPAMALLEEADEARKAGDTVTAGRRLERALNLAPGSSWIYRQLAELRLEQGTPEAAEGFIRRALRHAGNAVDEYRAALYELLAESLSRQGDWEGAADAQESAVQLR